MTKPDVPVLKMKVYKDGQLVDEGTVSAGDVQPMEIDVQSGFWPGSDTFNIRLEFEEP